MCEQWRIKRKGGVRVSKIGFKKNGSKLINSKIFSGGAPFFY